MRNALSIFLFASALVLVGCSGGSGSGSGGFRIPCQNGADFCLISCDLGCSQTGCSITEIAENQALRFKFSDEVDPATVNGSSVSLRTATGVAPQGDFEVVGSEVVFRPRVTTQNGVSTFGFLRNESYILSLAGGSTIAQSVTNMSGDGLSNEFTCTVIASRGILDADGEAPTVELLSPTVQVNAPVNPTIVLRFSELIDTTPLQVSLGEASPIRVVLRGTLPTGECDSDSDGTALEGVPQLSTELVGQREVTVVTFQPAVQLPGNSCITVRVTADLRDLSGRSGVPAKFVFLTEQGVSTPIEITETFSSSAKQEVLVSGGVWGGAQGPGARAGLIGSDGRHGSFDANYGTNLGGGIFVWNVDNTTIPAAASLTGLEYIVTDGRFFFTDLVIPEGMTIRFVGSVPPVIYVRGQADIRGSIEVNGTDAPSTVAASGLATGQQVSSFNAVVSLTGQPGTAGGVGAGAGGKGGDRGDNTGTGAGEFSGQAGADISVSAGHAYSGAASGTGGRGSLVSPVTGEWAVPTPTVGGIVYCAYFSPGGSGGGFSGSGGAPSNPVYTGTGAGSVNFSTPVGAGQPFSVTPYPPANPPPGYSSLEHFTVSGSGGGGGGSHGYGLIALGSPAQRFMAGHAGTGGGGAFAIRAGGSLIIGPAAQLSARGGDGVIINGSPANNNSSPGGGGSGGSLLLQSGQQVSIAGDINARGGTGSRNRLVDNGLQRVEATAGDGASGFFRAEAPNSSSGNPNVSFGGTSIPVFNSATMSGELTDRDGLSGDTSLFYTTGLVFPPAWGFYELDVDFDGDGIVDQTYDDSGAVGSIKASEPNGPITLPLVISFQGANLNQAGTQPVGPLGPWRDGIGAGAGQGINLDAVTGFRFSIIYNRTLFPNAVIKELRVFAQS